MNIAGMTNIALQKKIFFSDHRNLYRCLEIFFSRTAAPAYRL